MQQLYTIIYLAVIIGVFYLFIIRPQQQRQKEHNELISGLGTGDRVVSAGGIHGVVRSVEGDDLMLEVAPNVVVKMVKSAIVARESGEEAPTTGES